MSHLDDAQLDAYLAARAEFADYTNRREAGRHIADCAECSQRLKHAWAGHPESIDHPDGPLGRPSWPVLRPTRPIAPPAVTPRDSRPTRPTAAYRPSAVERAGRSATPPTATVEPEEDPLQGTPWPGLISALEAILRPAPKPETLAPRAERPDPEPQERPLARANGGEVVAHPSAEHAGSGLSGLQVPPEEPKLDEIELHEAKAPPAFNLDLNRRYERQLKRTRRQTRRFQVLATAAMLLVAVGLAGAVLRLGAKAPLVGESSVIPPPPPNRLPDTAPTTILENAVTPLAIADSLSGAQDSSATDVVSAQQSDRSSTSQRGAGTTGGAGPNGESSAAASPPTQRQARSRDGAGNSTPSRSRTRSGASTRASAAPSRASTSSRRASSDTGLTSGYWAETTTEHAERLLGHSLVLISGLSIESVARPTNTSGAFIRVAQVTPSGKRVALVLSRAQVSGGSPPPPGLSSIRVVPPNETSPTAMGAASWGSLMITVRADLPTDELRALLTRLEVRR